MTQHHHYTLLHRTGRKIVLFHKTYFRTFILNRIQTQANQFVNLLFHVLYNFFNIQTFTIKEPSVLHCTLYSMTITTATTIISEGFLVCVHV